MIFAATGHRPEKLHEDWDDIEVYYEKLCDVLYHVQPDKLIIGMASGFDLIAGFVAYCEGIPIVCAVPWKTHKARIEDIDVYDVLLANAESVVYVDESTKYPGSWVYQKRNEWMVDHAEMLISCWDGSRGGTYNCIKYADVEGKSVFNIHPQTFQARLLKSKEIQSA